MYFSTPDLSEYLIPEKVVVSLDITQPAVVIMVDGNADEAVGILDMQRRSPGDDSRRNSARILDVEHANMTKVIDNYQSVLQGFAIYCSAGPKLTIK